MTGRVPGAVLGAASIAAVLAAACALGPDYRRPETTTPAAYRFEHEATGDSIADTGWWQVYQDPVLQSLIREALANNLDVRIAAARVDQARAALGSARLQQLPQVSATAGATRERTSLYELPVGFPALGNVFSLEGSLSYEIDFWGKYRRATEAARAQLLQSAYAKQDVLAGLVASVATAYFTLQTLDEQLEITHRTVGTRQKFVDLTQAQHDRGTVSELDVATAQAQLAIAKANLPDLKRQIGQTEDQLSVLLGHNPDQILRSPGAAAAPGANRVPPPVPAAGLPSNLLERRPDLQEAEQNLVAANAQVGVAKANLFPSITLTAAGGGISTALSSLFSGPARTWSIGGNVLQPLLNPQRNLYQLDLADAQKRQALLQYQKSVQTAFQEVADALIAREQDADLQEAEEAQVDAQRRANTIALARYRVGYASYFNVIDADRDLFTAELTLSAARLNTLLSVVQLYRALGGGWQAEHTTPAPAGAPAH
jgi:multidrug efflux system outer membrane protein